MKPIASAKESRANGEPAPRLQLDRFLPYRLSILANTVSSGVARIYARRFQMTIPEWRVMAVLGCDGPQSANEVCGRTAMDKVQVSRAVARLIRAGSVRRAVDGGDRRRSVLTLTAAGLAVHDRIVPLARAAESRLLAALGPDERGQIDRLLAKLQDRAATILAPDQDASWP
ncbi:MAG: winged helix-turn-helix transcriptional regulator [Alphaproteobacteria bacterium]|nr:winged helix-turn-helix transcriptional regulator [Alphaproteobacteria bacterium]